MYKNTIYIYIYILVKRDIYYKTTNYLQTRLSAYKRTNHSYPNTIQGEVQQREVYQTKTLYITLIPNSSLKKKKKSLANNRKEKEKDTHTWFEQ